MTLKTWAPIKEKIKSAKPVAQVYRLKISLMGAEPSIWRRVLVQGGISLGKLHDVFQRAMGWETSHLHMFDVGNKHYAELDPEWEDVEDQWKVRLCDIAPNEKSKFIYTYDMGDGWRHDVVVESITEPNERLKGAAVCLAGANACPPEDCGGIGGYADFLVAISDPKHEEHERMLEWIGGSFDPLAFDLEKTNKRLKKIK